LSLPSVRSASLLVARLRRVALPRALPKQTSELGQHEYSLAASVHATPAPEVQSEVVTAFQLQRVHVADGLERASHGAVLGGRTAIATCAFVLVSVVGAGIWFGRSPRAPAAASSGARAAGLTSAEVPVTALTNTSASPPLLQPFPGGVAPQVYTLDRGDAHRASPRRKSSEGSNPAARAFSTPRKGDMAKANTTLLPVVSATSISSAPPVTAPIIPRVYRMRPEETQPGRN
jgi:hypothetical protein